MRRRTVSEHVTRPTNAEVLRFGKGFDKYKPESAKEVRQVDIKDDEVLRQLKDAWRQFEQLVAGTRKYTLQVPKSLTLSPGRTSPVSLPSMYSTALRAVRRLKFSSKDVEKFSIAMIEFQGERHFSRDIGLFLSALINNGKEMDYVIHTRHLDVKIRNLCRNNTKNIRINGNVGWGFGWKMHGGSVMICGDADMSVGKEMFGGNITVKGSAVSLVGSFMKGGSITIEGNAGGQVGYMMKGGEIHLNGDYENIAGNVLSGKIYHKGKLIVDKTKGES